MSNTIVTNSPTQEQIDRAAVKLSPNLRRQIVQMHKVDGLGSAEIHELLGVSEDVVAGELARAAAGEQGDRSMEERGATEELLDRYKERAAEVMGELVEYSDNEVVKLRAAEYILDTAAGLKRPKRDNSNDAAANLTQINIYLEQAATAYRKQVEAATAIPA